MRSCSSGNRSNRGGVLLAAIVWLAVAAAPPLTACAKDPAPRCSEAYDHLVRLAKRSADGGQRARFISACTEAWDDGHQRCLLKARTVEEALDCRATRVRPG